jgi:hypothetical protein
MLSTDNENSSRYAAYYAAASAAPLAIATHAPKATATPIQKTTRVTWRGVGDLLEIFSRLQSSILERTAI